MFSSLFMFFFSWCHALSMQMIWNFLEKQPQDLMRQHLSLNVHMTSDWAISCGFTDNLKLHTVTFAKRDFINVVLVMCFFIFHLQRNSPLFSNGLAWISVWHIIPFQNFALCVFVDSSAKCVCFFNHYHYFKPIISP